MKASYINVLRYIKLKKEINLKSWTKSQGYFKMVDTSYYNLIKLLDLLKIKYKLGNNTKRQGQEGDYIFICCNKNNKNYVNLINGKIDVESYV